MSAALERPYPRLGLKPPLVRELLERHPDAEPWRVSAVDRGLCSVLGLDEAHELVTRRVRPPSQPIAVGDWVVVDDTDAVTSVLERMTVLRRAAAGPGSGEQLIAANVDTVFVVAAFAETAKLERRGLNARRLDRFIAAAADGGALAVVVLNKVDLSRHDDSELHDLVADLGARLGGTEVIAASAEHAIGIERLEPHLAPGETVGFLGPSGVGKSTLINRLLGESRQKVGAVRELDTKGRHVTTRRELIVMPSGALLIDTPGMRELAVLSDGDDVAGFSDIDALAERCRFSDCEHDTEPGCAVRAAVDAGELPLDRLESYRNLSKEAERHRTRHDAFARHLEKKEGKRFGRMVREAKASKRGKLT